MPLLKSRRLRPLLERIPLWMRIVMNRRIDRVLAALPVSQLDAVEVSGHLRGKLPWRTFTPLNYPEFDLCQEPEQREIADVVFCEQILEHVVDPQAAATNLFHLLRPGGLAIISTPFLVRIHNEPADYWRFTPAGLQLLLERAGFTNIRVHDWGNFLCLVANLWQWCPYVPLVQSLRRDPSLPLVVWAFARRPSFGD